MNVLVADDSILFRKVMADVLSSFDGVNVVGQAQNGKIALRKVQELKPDVLTLDMEMPEMDGLAVLDALQEIEHAPTVIVVSALTQRGGKITLQALSKGAFDFITKPDAGNAQQSRDTLRSDLAPQIKTLALKLSVKGILNRSPSQVKKIVLPEAVQAPAPRSGTDDISLRMSRLTGKVKPEMVLIGVSTGGPNALARVVPALPARLGVPVFIVQHMPPIFTQTLAESLNSKSALTVCEASDGMVAVPDTVYIAPGGRQMRLTESNGTRVIQITDDPPENNCRPAVDYLFRSVSNFFPGRAMAVILTGMGSDGALGAKLLKRHGCFVISQDEASCVVYGMPKAVVDAGLADDILSLDMIPGRIADVVRSGA